MFKSPQYSNAVLYVNYGKGSMSSNLKSQKGAEFSHFLILGDHLTLSRSLLEY